MNEDFYTIECKINSKQYTAGKFNIICNGELHILDSPKFSLNCNKETLPNYINSLDISQLDEIKIKYTNYDKIN